MILFLTPRDSSQFDAAFYANLDYGKNVQSQWTKKFLQHLMMIATDLPEVFKKLSQEKIAQDGIDWVNSGPR